MQAITASPEHATPAEDNLIRDIHALTPPPINRNRQREAWETTSHRTSSISEENFTTMSREFNALVIAGGEIGGHGRGIEAPAEESAEIEMNRLAIVPENHAFDENRSGSTEIVTMQSVKKEEVEAKISAWQNAKIAKINNRFKREDAVISGWESEQVHKATSWIKKIERRLEEKRARAIEKMENEVAKAHRKAEERRASAEAKRGTKVAKIFEISKLMRAVGRPPAKRSFF